MDKNYIGDTPGMGQCFCSGACEKLGYCPNVPQDTKYWNLVPTTQGPVKTSDVYVAVSGEEYEGITYVLGVGLTVESAKSIVDTFYKESNHFLPDWIRILRVPVDTAFDLDREYKTVLYLRKDTRMIEAEED